MNTAQGVQTDTGTEPREQELSIRIPAGGRPSGASALLIPIPPETTVQSFSAIHAPCGWQVRRVETQEGSQSALYAVVDDRREWTINLTLRNEGRPVPLAHFRDSGGGAGELGEDVLELYDSLNLEGASLADKASVIAQCLARRFQYQHGGVGGELPSLSCDALSGNCLDINTAFMRLLEVAGVPCAYYIGYFFPAQDEQQAHSRELVTHDWHCWVSTLDEQNNEWCWDIAHHIKRGLAPVQPALNPVPGRRFAVSAGRNLTFDLPEGRVCVSHLGFPRWIRTDGSTLETIVQAVSRPILADSPVEES